MNLARNIGGSVGISFVTTLLSRRTQFHQARLSENLSAGSAPLQSNLQGLTARFMQGGLDAASATQKAYAMLQANVIRQATMLAYVDCFWLLGAVIICLVPVVFLMKRARPGGPIAAH
jgi:DHA2 family multidrug resistance protein